MRLFSEQEIGAILKRTAELSKQADRGVQDGLSLEEIQQLAADAGLDPALVSRAAAEISSPGAGETKSDLFGGPLAYSTDVDLDIDVDEEAWESMLPAIRAAFNDPGTVSVREGTFEWTGTGGDNKKAHVHIRKTASGTRLHVFWSQMAMAIPFFVPTFVSLFISLPIVFEELHLGPAGIPVIALIVGAMFMLSRFGVTTMRKHYIRKIDRLSKDLSMVAYEHAAADKEAVDSRDVLRRDSDQQHELLADEMDAPVPDGRIAGLESIADGDTSDSDSADSEPTRERVRRS